ncbi:MAG: T9SS type A sorting domain-containing protein [Bacteroidales bacterium]|nr:T9SS type A sorting domain-containing protein [Bacteroidales bacterium]
MKAKPLYVFLLLLLATAGRARAQGYQSYFGADSTVLNMYLVITDFDQTVFLTIHSDDTVMVNNHTYLRGRLSGNDVGVFYGDPFYFREDTVTGRLYHYFPSLDEELLLSDMSLSVGDTIAFSDMWGSRPAIVESISYENGRKVIHLIDSYDVYDYMDFTFREGVFPNILPVGYHYYYGDCYIFLLCVAKDGVHVFKEPFFNTCYIDGYLSVQRDHQHRLSVYPTIVYPSEAIRIEATDPISDIALFDLYGRESPVFVDKLSLCHWNLTVQNGVSGVYIIKITTRKGISFEKIFISNH